MSEQGDVLVGSPKVLYGHRGCSHLFVHKVWEALSHLAFLLIKHNIEDFQPFGN